MDLLRSIKIFVQVAEMGSFSRAAIRLNLSAAAVSRHIAYLESALANRLLNRTTRKLRLTDFGQACLERYRRILEELDEVDRAAQAGALEPQGPLRVTSTMLFWMWRIAPRLPRFLQRFPKVSIQVNLTERIVDLVEEGYDLALQIDPPNARGAVGKSIVPLRRVICASPTYVKRNGPITRPEDLQQHNCLLYAHYAETVEWRFRRAGQEIDVPVNGNLRSNDATTLKLAALAGVGVSRTPVFLIDEELATGALVPLLREYEVISPNLWVVYPSRRQLAPRVRVFIDFLEQDFASDQSPPAATIPRGSRRVRRK